MKSVLTAPIHCSAFLLKTALFSESVIFMCYCEQCLWRSLFDMLWKLCVVSFDGLWNMKYVL